MKVFFDFPNLISFIHSAGQPEYNDCMRMLLDNFELHVSFSQEEIEKMNGDDKDDFVFWISSIDNLASEIKWNDQRFYDSFNPYDLGREYLMTVYCIQSGQKEADKGTLLIAKEGEELKTLSSLFIKGNQYMDNIFDKISKWKDLLKYSSPCTDIVIADSFIMSDNSLLSSNIIPICRELCSRAKNQKVNIVIITLKDDSKSKDDWKTIRSKIKDGVGGKFRPNVTIVEARRERKDGEQRIKEHDRTIFTNYKLFVSGDSYNYFDSNGNKITGGRWLHVHSNADRDNMRSSMRFIDDMQEIISETEKVNVDLIKSDERCDKKSNFLRFQASATTSNV